MGLSGNIYSQWFIFKWKPVEADTLSNKLTFWQNQKDKNLKGVKW